MQHDPDRFDDGWLLLLAAGRCKRTDAQCYGKIMISRSNKINIYTDSHKVFENQILELYNYKFCKFALLLITFSGC